jgi:hypothetical protein
MTLDAIRAFVGTPSAEQLAAASVDENLQFVRFLVDPRKAEGRRLAFTIAAEGDPRIRRLELRNSVLVITEADAKAPMHVDLTRRELAEFVLGTGGCAKAGNVLGELNGVLDRSHLKHLSVRTPAVIDPKGKATYTGGLEH